MTSPCAAARPVPGTAMVYAGMCVFCRKMNKTSGPLLQINPPKYICTNHRFSEEIRWDHLFDPETCREGIQRNWVAVTEVPHNLNKIIYVSHYFYRSHEWLNIMISDDNHMVFRLIMPLSNLLPTRTGVSLITVSWRWCDTSCDTQPAQLATNNFPATRFISCRRSFTRNLPNWMILITWVTF